MVNPDIVRTIETLTQKTFFAVEWNHLRKEVYLQIGANMKIAIPDDPQSPMDMAYQCKVLGAFDLGEGDNIRVYTLVTKCFMENRDV